MNVNVLVSEVMTKSEDRVPEHYQKGTEDWKAKYNMLLPDGITCADCVHVKRCTTIFGAKEDNTSCDFYPNRFIKKGGK